VLGSFEVPIDVVVVNEAKARRRAKVAGTMVERAARTLVAAEGHASHTIAS
jgi:hypothetical protein